MSPGHHEPYGSSYNNDPWMASGSYAQQGQHGQHGSQGQNDYTGYEYVSTTPVPMEPSYTMSRPPPYAAPQHNQMPPPLIMPQQQHIWPSMLANSSYQQPILPAVSVQTPLSATSIGSDMTPTSAKTTTSRRKLTDDERRLMCLEAENNPTMKQTQIGAKFNVERSTVSKILRQKEKYMRSAAPKEEASSPGKKTKARQPDVEKTLINWSRNQQKRGLPITTEELRKQVLMFTSGREDQSFYTSTEWLETFQRKHLSGSSTSTSREATAETSTSHSGTIDSSPASENGLVSPPMSATEDSSHHRTGFSEDAFDFKIEYEQSPLLPHGFPSDGQLSSDVLMSPLSPEMSRDYVSIQYSDSVNSDSGYSRQRSMTLPHLAPGGSPRPASSDRSIPPLPARAMTTINEHKSASIDPRQTMKRHKSVPDIHEAEIARYSTMQPPPLPRSADISPVSIPVSPMYQDETIKALHDIKKLLEQRPDVAEPDDYVMIGKLMEKLKLLKARSPTGTPSLSGRMHRFDPADSPRISKKRTVVEMSM